MKTIWIVSGETESGDHYPLMAQYDHEPTEEELKELICEFEEDYGFDDGPGDFGSYMFLKINQIEVEKIRTKKKNE